MHIYIMEQTLCLQLRFRSSIHMTIHMNAYDPEACLQDEVIFQCFGPIEDDSAPSHFQKVLVLPYNST